MSVGRSGTKIGLLQDNEVELECRREGFLVSDESRVKKDGLNRGGLRKRLDVDFDGGQYTLGGG